MNISVALCTFNGETFLDAQLASFTKQIYLPSEIVVCDDGSQDGTLDRIQKFAAKAPFPVRIYVNDVRLGSTKNFEQAIRLCRGEVIVLSDQDDVWCDTKIQRIDEVLSQNSDVGLVFSDAKIVDANLTPLGYCLWDSIGFTTSEQQPVSQGNAAQVLVKHNVVTGATMAFRSSLQSYFLPIPAEWVHDAWIALLCSLHTKLLPVREPLIQYRQHGNNQIGAPSTSLYGQVRYSLAQDKAQQRKIYEAYCVLEERIKQDFGDAHDVLHLVREQQTHRHARATMPRQRLYRIPKILRELFTGRYHRFSSGFYGATKDLLS